MLTYLVQMNNTKAINQKDDVSCVRVDSNSKRCVFHSSAFVIRNKSRRENKSEEPLKMPSDGWY